MEWYRSVIPVLPMRAEPCHKSEMISEILFGECFTIHKKIDEWYFIECAHDGYKGWVILSLFEEVNTINAGYRTQDPLSMTSYNNRKLHVPYGSLLGFDSGQNIPNRSISKSIIPIHEQLEKFISVFENAPYRWGGRTILGIDCSGLTQLFYFNLGISLQRDASLQILQGKQVQFSDIQIGDLAFFQSNEGIIHHVGIVLSENHIFHASKYVKIDLLTSDGIYSTTQKERTHLFHSVRRYSEL